MGERDPKVGSPLLEESNIPEGSYTADISCLEEEPVSVEKGKRLTTLELTCLTLALSGLQFTWSVELAYGTPYLISLGMPKPLLSLVWLAGPLSGLLVQPIIGCISDRSKSKYGRRRPFIVGGFVLVLFSMILIAYTKDFGSIFFSPTSKSYSLFVMSLATFGFYVLDFSINGIQACLRALIVDVSPLEQQDIANAFASRMIGFGNIFGYFVGFINLVDTFPYLGNSQMKILCIFASLIFGITLGITCFTVSEIPYEIDHEDFDQPISLHFFGLVFKRVFKSFMHLPTCIQKICNVQFFAWIAWFPFLFYSTTWVAEIMGRTQSSTQPGFRDHATQTGSFAFFIYSVVSLVSTFILPIFVYNELGHRNDSGVNRSYTRFSLFTKRISDPFSWLNLRVLFFLSLVFFGTLMMSTYFVNNVVGASFIIAMSGISWSIMMWAPFSLIGEFTNLLNRRGKSPVGLLSRASDFGNSEPSSSTYSNLVLDQDDRNEDELDAGLILGVHNIYIVLPQFLVNFMISILFYLTQTPDKDVPVQNGNDTIQQIENHKARRANPEYISPSDNYIPIDESSKNAALSSLPANLNITTSLPNSTTPGNVTNPSPEPVGLIFRIGGLSSLIASYLALKIPSPNQIH